MRTNLLKTAYSLATLTVLILVAACGEAGRVGRSNRHSDESQLYISSSSKIYVDLQTLAMDADVVASGILGPVVDRLTDYGAGDDQDSGIPMVFYRFSVQDAGKGGDKLPSEITVGWLDHEKIASEEATPLEEGGQYVLYLEELSATDAPGVSDLAPFYVPLSADAGVFETGGGGVARPRDERISSLTPPTDATADEPPVELQVAELLAESELAPEA